MFDPDEEVQAAVRAVFEEFDRLGSIHGVLRVLVERGVRIWVRRRIRPDLGTLEWYRPHRGMLIHMLRHPIYAGAYAYGRRRVDPRRQQPGRPASGRTPLLPPSEWLVCLRHRRPAYIRWAQPWPSPNSRPTRLGVTDSRARRRATGGGHGRFDSYRRPYVARSPARPDPRGRGRASLGLGTRGA